MGSARLPGPPPEPELRAQSSVQLYQASPSGDTDSQQTLLIASARGMLSTRGRKWLAGVCVCGGGSHSACWFLAPATCTAMGQHDHAQAWHTQKQSVQVLLTEHIVPLSPWRGQSPARQYFRVGADRSRLGRGGDSVVPWGFAKCTQSCS